MPDSVVEPLLLDLLEWIGTSPRPYHEVMEVWRTSCPRLPVWEEANDRGYIVRTTEVGRGQLVAVSTAGLEHLSNHRSRVDPQPLLAPLARTKSLTA